MKMYCRKEKEYVLLLYIKIIGFFFYLIDLGFIFFIFRIIYEFIGLEGF